MTAGIDRRTRRSRREEGGTVFILRRAQLTAIEAAFAGRFVDELAAHLRANFRPYLDRQGVADRDVERFVRDGLTAADGFEITGEADLKLFVEVAALLGPGFHDDPKYPWARDVLNRPGWSGTAKMDAVEAHLLFEHRP